MGLLLAAPASAAWSCGPSTIEVWVELSEPVPRPGMSASAAQARAARVTAQQEAVAEALRVIGATELARVHATRNAIAIRVDGARLDDVKSIPGVKRVRPARTLHPPKSMP